MGAFRYVAIILVAAALIALVTWGLGGSDSSETTTVEIGGESFELKVAADPATITRGLMDVEEIEPDGGMIFVFVYPRLPSFWMKNCLVDIDLLYLDERRRILSMHEMKVEPPQGEDETEEAYEARLSHYEGEALATFAVELRAGTIERLGLKEGDRLEFDHLALKRIAR